MELKKKWYEILEERFNALMTKHDMPEDIAIELYNFILETAKDQFKSGNKSGIAWILRKQSEESQARAQSFAPVAA